MMELRYRVLSTFLAVTLSVCVAAWLVGRLLYSGASQPSLISDPPTAQAPETPPSTTARSSDLGELPDNFMEVSPRLFCGATPQNQRQFKELQKRGIRTIVSVDGSQPNLTTANALGLSYVHIPLKYRGLDDPELTQLLRLAADLTERPEARVYVHCHHGVQRGPTATALLFKMLFFNSEPQADGKRQEIHASAMNILKTAGTDEKYRGLFRAVEEFTPEKLQLLLPSIDGIQLEEMCQQQSLAMLMARVGDAFESLEEGLHGKNQRSSNELHEQTLLIHENLKESLRESLEHSYADDLRTAIELASKLERLAFKGDLESELFTRTLTSLDDSCSICHQRHRN